jgi:phage tail-like protein
MAGFGHAPFGHYPFGHSSSSVQIQDLAFNPIANPSTAQMLGFTDTTGEDTTIGLEINGFIFRSIRHEDEQGNLFLKRFLQGPQSVWNSIQDKIDELQALWDVTAIDDRWLVYQKSIVGWESSLDHITDELTDDQLRRLISASMALWKSRGNEDSITDLLQLATGARMRIWNWFDFRWILDETALGEAHDGYDSWMIYAPDEDEDEEYWSNLRIVDDGTLNRKLVKDIVKMMRAVGERFEIVYLALLDLFEVDGDDSQWYDTYQDAAIGGPMVVANGANTLGDNTVQEAAITQSNEALGWDNYVSYWRAKISQDGISAGMATFRFYCADLDNSFILAMDPANNRFRLGTLVATVQTYYFDAVMPEGIHANVYYGIRIAITPATSNQVHVVVYVDNVEIFNTNAPDFFVAGGIGFGHEIAQTITVAEVEVLRLPVESDTVTINTD